MVDWTGLASTQSWSGAQIISNGIGVIQGRIAANGQGPIIINTLRFFAGGRGGARSMVGTLGSASISWTAPSTSNAVDSGVLACSQMLVSNGGSFQITMDAAGSAQFYFGKGTTGNTFQAGTGYVWSPDGAIFGSYGYVQAPTAPTVLSVVPHPNSSGSVIIQFSGSADNGGAGVTNYRVYRNGTHFLNTVSGYVIDSGLTPGVTYTYQVTADNQVTSAAGTTSVLSNSGAAIAPGNPTEPRTLTAVASTTVYGRVSTSWVAPLSTNGGITGYDVTYVDGSNNVSTLLNVGNVTSYVFDALKSNVSYTFSVRARNAFSDTNSQYSFSSNSVVAVSPGPPSAPRTLTSIASISVAGRIDLSWVIPSDTAGGITQYSVYYDNDTLVGFTTALTYQINGLVPGTQYQFYVRAWNATADAMGVPGDKSNITTATATGQPPAPVAISASPSPVVAGRLVITWNSLGGAATGYNVYTLAGSLYTRVAATANTTVNLDNLTPGISYSFTIRGKNAVTDAANTDGPNSNVITGIPGSTTTQSVPNLTVSNSTNALFSGGFTIAAATAVSLTYARTSANIASALVPAGATVTDTTNISLNGTYSVASIPTATSFTYAKVMANLALVPSLGGLITNNTNQVFNGTYAVTVVDAPTKAVSYAKVNANISTRLSGGVIVNATNSSFNGTSFAITSVTLDSFTYAKVAGNVVSSSSTGTVINITNRDVFNGNRLVAEVPMYNTLTYAISATADMAARTLATPYGDMSRTTSKSVLDINYRSGWAG